MSKATKRKHVVKEVLDDFVLPEGQREVVKVTAGRGNNLHEVETAASERFLVSMPTKFRKNVWIKRGDYVLIEPIAEGDKVRGEIVNILYKEQIKHIKEEGLWPAAFEDKSMTAKTDSSIPDDMLPPSDDSADEGLADMVVNTNRPCVVYEDSDSDDDSDEENIQS